MSNLDNAQHHPIATVNTKEEQETLIQDEKNQGTKRMLKQLASHNQDPKPKNVQAPIGTSVQQPVVRGGKQSHGGRAKSSNQKKRGTAASRGGLKSTARGGKNSSTIRDTGKGAGKQVKATKTVTLQDNPQDQQNVDDNAEDGEPGDDLPEVKSKKSSRVKRNESEILNHTKNEGPLPKQHTGDPDLVEAEVPDHEQGGGYFSQNDDHGWEDVGEVTDPIPLPNQTTLTHSVATKSSTKLSPKAEQSPHRSTRRKTKVSFPIELQSTLKRSTQMENKTEQPKLVTGTRYDVPKGHYQTRSLFYRTREMDRYRDWNNRTDEENDNVWKDNFGIRRPPDKRQDEPVTETDFDSEVTDMSLSLKGKRKGKGKAKRKAAAVMRPTSYGEEEDQSHKNGKAGRELPVEPDEHGSTNVEDWSPRRSERRIAVTQGVVDRDNAEAEKDRRRNESSSQRSRSHKQRIKKVSDVYSYG